MKKDIYPYDIMELVVNSMKVPGVDKVYFFAGRRLEILKELNTLDNSITYTDRKYPFVAFEMPAPRHYETTGYPVLTIPRIVIANLVTAFNGEEMMRFKFGADGNFKKILYPCYNELLIQFARSRHIIGSDPNGFKHTMFESPGVQPIGQGSSDYVDFIELQNVNLIINQIKTC